MSDKSLPKPVPPQTPPNSAGSNPATGTAPGGSSSTTSKPSLSKSKSPNSKPPKSKPPMGNIPGKPPVGNVPMSKPPGSFPNPGKPPVSLGGMPPKTVSSQTSLSSKPANSAAVASANPVNASANPANPPANNKDTKKKPKFANVKQSPFKYLPFLIGGLVIIGLVWAIISRIGGGSSSAPAPTTPSTGSNGQTNTNTTTRKTVPAERTSLTYWGLWEPDSTISQVLQQFEQGHEGVKINYVKQSHKDYRERLQTAIASGNGPDVFRFHASWTPMLSAELAAMPQSVMSASEYQQTFYPVAAELLNLNGQIVGIPLMYDGLGLYYNQEMLTAASANPPGTWAEVKTLANKLTVREGEVIKRGGIALGNASNVEHFSDILGLLMLQNGADLVKPSSQATQDALKFYTNFVKQDRVWDEKLPSSTVAFARGDVAMMIAPSWRAHEVMSINPNLQFGIAPVPQLGGEKITWGTFWAEGVSDKSKNKTIGWELLKYLSSAEVQKQLYNSQAQVRSFGEIYSRSDIANDLADNQYVAPYLEDASTAKGWYLSSYTHDNGINDLMIKYYQDAINAVLDGETVQKALQTVSQGTAQVLRQYGVN